MQLNLRVFYGKRVDTINSRDTKLLERTQKDNN